MPSAVIYLANGFFKVIAQFFSDWYWGSFLFLQRFAVRLLRFFESIFAVRLMVVNMFQPLYQDHSFIGHGLGFIFRIIRIICGLAIDILIIASVLVIYIAWLAIPSVLIYRILFV